MQGAQPAIFVEVVWCLIIQVFSPAVYQPLLASVKDQRKTEIVFGIILCQNKIQSVYCPPNIKNTSGYAEYMAFLGTQARYLKVSS